MLNDVGVLPDSVRYYHDADEFTTVSLFSVPHAGVYHCDRAYQIQRDYLGVCQMILVDEGKLTVAYRGETKTVMPGTLVLLDCREPHRYYAASDTLRFRWFHLIGSSSGANTQRILNVCGFCLPAAESIGIERCFQSIMNAVRQNQPDCHALSVTIHQLLALLATSFGEPEKHGLEKVIQDSADYIDQHCASAGLSIAVLAKRCALSPCYYTRKFKEYQSVTPHQYILAARLRMAKQRLSTTSDSVEQIAEVCGFSNSSHFIQTFQKTVGMTPLRFRTMWK